MTDIKPALTAEEWRTFLRNPAETEDLVAKLRDEVMADSPHGAAALCLHNQPFGFTRGDVHALHGGAAMADEGGTPGIADDLRDLAELIDALLPPEDLDD